MQYKKEAIVYMIPHVIPPSPSHTHICIPPTLLPDPLLYNYLLFTTQVVTLEKDIAFDVFDIQSLHSEHTVYEEIFHSSTTEKKGDDYI